MLKNFASLVKFHNQCLLCAFLSAFLDALTVIAVIISVAVGFYSVYHKVASGKEAHHDHDHNHDKGLPDFNRNDLEQFRGFLRNLLMHAAVGTALGGVCTIVGEPQNLIIGQQAGWEFIEFAIRMSPVTIPVFISGMLTCVLLEKLKWSGHCLIWPVGRKFAHVVACVLFCFAFFGGFCVFLFRETNISAGIGAVCFVSQSKQTPGFPRALCLFRCFDSKRPVPPLFRLFRFVRWCFDCFPREKYYYEERI